MYPCGLQLNFPVGKWHDLEASPARWDLPVFLFALVFPFPEELWKRLAETGEMHADIALLPKGMFLLLYFVIIALCCDCVGGIYLQCVLCVRLCGCPDVLIVDQEWLH